MTAAPLRARSFAPTLARALAPALAPALALVLGGLSTACTGVGGNLFGAIDGTDFDPVVGYWGGPFIVFSNQSIDCIDLWWVSRNLDEDELPWEEDFDLLQVTFNDSQVVEGSFDVSGVSPVSAARLSHFDGSYSINEATSGRLDLKKVSEAGKVKGDMDIQLAGGFIEGSFAVPDCVNLTSAY